MLPKLGGQSNLPGRVLFPRMIPGILSGKTLAFGIPAICHLLKCPAKINGSSTISVLVVAPTRELALQTHDTLSALGKPFGIASVAVFGGVPKEPQAKMLKNASKAKNGMTTRIIVGTPGRILDFVQEETCDLSQCVIIGHSVWYWLTTAKGQLSCIR